MTVPEIAALVMAGVALAGLYFQRRKVAAEEDFSAIANISRLLADLKSAHDQIDLYRDQLESSRDQEDDCQSRLMDERRKHASTVTELGMLVHEIATLKSAMPALSIADKLQKIPSSLKRVLDKCHDGIALSTRNDGELVYCNATFCAALDMTEAEILKVGWRALMHPDDMERALTQEAKAWNDLGQFVGRYRHRDGSWVTMRWHFTQYEDGYAFSVVWFERRRTDMPVMSGEA